MANGNRRPDWDMKQLMERLDGDHEFMCELLLIFREDSQSNLERARGAVWERDLPTLMRTAHTIKGMLRNLSMNAAAEMAFAVETASRQGKEEETEAALSELEHEVRELLSEVDAHLAEVKA
jgi:two-component system, sensor histidine kinase and response regulator